MRSEDKVYKAYYDSKEKKLYFNQLKELTKLSHSSLQNALKKATKEGILKKEKTKSNVFYEIRDKRKAAIKFAEFSINRFKDLNRGVRMPLQELIKKIPKDVFTIVLFGFAARKQETENSDIDILVVSEKKTDINKKEFEAVSNYPLNIFNCNISQFTNPDDHVVIQARKTGFPIYKEQNFFEAVL